MKTTLRYRSVAVVMAITIRRVMRSEKVANAMFQASFLFFLMAVTGGELLTIFAGMAFTAAAAKHLDKVERGK